MCCCSKAHVKSVIHKKTKNWIVINNYKPIKITIIKVMMKEKNNERERGEGGRGKEIATYCLQGAQCLKQRGHHGSTCGRLCTMQPLRAAWLCLPPRPWPPHRPPCQVAIHHLPLQSQQLPPPTLWAASPLLWVPHPPWWPLPAFQHHPPSNPIPVLPLLLLVALLLLLLPSPLHPPPLTCLLLLHPPLTLTCLLPLLLVWALMISFSFFLFCFVCFFYIVFDTRIQMPPPPPFDFAPPFGAPPPLPPR